MAQHRSLATPTYLVAFALTVIPPFDALMTVIPFRLGEARWRFGAFGLLSNALMLSLTGLVLALIIASVLEHNRFRRVLGVISGLGALVMASAWVVFALDVLQVRNQVTQTAAFAFKVASVTAAAKSGLGIVILIAVTIAAFRGPKVTSSSKVPRGNLVIGRPTPREVAAAEPSA